jgi:hypothetical protein
MGVKLGEILRRGWRVSKNRALRRIFVTKG